MKVTGIKAIRRVGAVVACLVVVLRVQQVFSWAPPEHMSSEELELVFRGKEGWGEGFGWLATPDFLYFTSFVAHEGRRIYRTQNGLDWENIANIPCTSAGYGRLVQATNGSLFLSAEEDYPKIYRSDDEGQTWTMVKTVFDRHIHDLVWWNDSLFYATGDTNKTVGYWRKDLGWQDASFSIAFYGTEYKQQGLHFFVWNNHLYLTTETNIPCSRIYNWNGTTWSAVSNFLDFRGISAIWATATDQNQRVYFGAGTRDRTFPVLVYSDDMKSFNYVYVVDNPDAVLSLQVVGDIIYYFTSDEEYFYKGYLGSSNQATFKRIYLPSGYIAYGWHGSVQWNGYIYFGTSAVNIFRFRPVTEDDNHRFRGKMDGVVLTNSSWGITLGEDYSYSLVDSDDFESGSLDSKWQLLDASGNLGWNESHGTLSLKTNGVGGFYTNTSIYRSFKMEVLASASNGITLFYYVKDVNNFFCYNFRNPTSEMPQSTIEIRKRIDGAWVTDGIAEATADFSLIKNLTLWVKDGWQTRIYVNGTLILEQNFPRNWRIGYVGIGAYYGNAHFDEVRVWNLTVSYRHSGTFQTDYFDGEAANPSWNLLWLDTNISFGQSINLEINSKDEENGKSTVLVATSLKNGLNWYSIDEVQGHRYIQLIFSLTTNDNGSSPSLSRGYGLQPYTIFPLSIVKSTCEISTSPVLSFSKSETQLAFTVNAEPDNLSVVEIHVVNNSKPLRVEGATSWDYDNMTHTITLNLTVSGFQRITITWEAGSFVPEYTPETFLIIAASLAFMIVVICTDVLRFSRRKKASAEYESALEHKTD